MNVKREILIRLPKLNDCSGNLSKKWFIYYSVRDPRNGKMKRFKSYAGLHAYKTEKERYQKARDIIAELSDKLKHGWTPFENESNVIYDDQLEYSHIAETYGTKRQSNKTVRFYASKFTEKFQGLDPATIITYKSKLRKFTQWLQLKNLHEHDVSIINNKVILDFFHYLIVEKKRSRVTIKKYNQLLYNLFDFMVDKKVIQQNPVFNIPKATYEPDHAARPIQDMDMERFMRYADTNDKQLALSMRFEFNCFLRPKEIRFMKIKWIDFAFGTIIVPKWVFKTRHDRIAQIPDDFLLRLREMKLQDEMKEYYVIGKNGKPGPMHLGTNTMRSRFNRARKALNMPSEYKYYSPKHSGNVRAEMEDLPMIDRMHQNGHLSYKTTEVYTRNKIGRVAKSFKQNFTSI